MFKFANDATNYDIIYTTVSLVNTQNQSPNIYHGCFLLITLQADVLDITAWAIFLLINLNLRSYKICFINVDITQKPLCCSL